ncbi:hypothetical protein B4135_0866 [Caldibacillus debilis]|uniref:Uncharacterized protein n=1 Tax=Caldibacillus debilis TaxID=301148 RepID=A0A150M5S6_9BACI|nr:hypothetical protein B4135_0866 [Caldibacillus debilis]
MEKQPVFPKRENEKTGEPFPGTSGPRAGIGPEGKTAVPPKSLWNFCVPLGGL